MLQLVPAFLLAALCAVAPYGRASETDQFTLPPAPLADLGPVLASRVLDAVRAEVAAFNARRTIANAAIDESILVMHIYEQVGVGVPESTLEREIRYGDLKPTPARFNPGLTESVYAWVFAPVPFALVTFSSPTVDLYGVDVGTDKIGHLLQQGYEYLTWYERARALGADEASAVAAAVKYGVWSENGLYGLLLTGVYSNGDLAANYAGFKFYRNLLHEVRIGNRVLGPIIRHDGASLYVDPDRDNADLLKPFITEHLNEAYNPSFYKYDVEAIRRHVRERCARWRAEVPDFTEATYRAHLERTKTWHGEDYGWQLAEPNAATLLECFGTEAGRTTAEAAR